MNIDGLKSFYENLQSDGVLFSFSGPLSQAILEGIGETVRKKMRLESTKMGTIQRVFSILVEQAQNILNYSAETTPDPADGPKAADGKLRSGTLVLSIENGNYCVLCGNYIAADKSEALRRELTMLRDLTPDALKTLYRERRKAPSPPDSTGAGLGLIEIARRVTKPLVFDIRPMDDATDFFAVKAII
jgi:hypothetical protein